MSVIREAGYQVVGIRETGYQETLLFTVFDPFDHAQDRFAIVDFFFISAFTP